MKGLKKCKTGLGACEVSEAAKSCINCRYNKCLSIGMSPDLLQGKRKREEEEEEEEVVEPEPEEKVLSEPTREKDEEPDLEPEDVAGQPEQEQPLKLVKKTITAAETGNIFNLNLVHNEEIFDDYPQAAPPTTDHQ